MAPGRKRRSHKPHELGPRVYREAGSRWWKIDMRPWGGGRVAVRDPKAPGWPRSGTRTELREVAERWKWDYLDRVRTGQIEQVSGVRAPRRRTVTQAVEDYLRRRSKQVAAATWENDRTALKVHLIPAIGSRALTSVTQEEVDGLIDTLLDEGYARYTVFTYGVHIQTFFRAHGFEWDLDLPERRHTVARHLTDEELSEVESQALVLGLPEARSIMYAVSTGMRQRELPASEYEDISHPFKSVRVTKQIARSGGIAPLKGKRARVALVLPHWWQYHDKRGTGPVLADRRTLGSMQRLIVRVLKAAGVYEVGMGWHVLRHTYARLYLTMGAKLQELQKSLGHASLITTETTYGHLAPSDAVALARQAIYRESGTLNGRPPAEAQQLRGLNP